MADHIDGALPHLAARDVTFVVVSRAPLAEIRPFQERMGWRFKWVSSHGSDFNYDFHTTTDEAVAPVEYKYRDKATLEQLGQTYHVKGEQPGASVFLRDGGRVYHTYSRTAAAWICWSARTTTSTSCRKAATKTLWRSRWDWGGTTTNTTAGARHDRTRPRCLPAQYDCGRV